MPLDTQRTLEMMTNMKRLTLPLIFTRRCLLDAWNPTRQPAPQWAELVYHADIMEIFMRPTNDEFIDSAHREPVGAAPTSTPESQLAANDVVYVTAQEDHEHRENCDCVGSFFVGCFMGALCLGVWVCVMSLILN